MKLKKIWPLLKKSSLYNSQAQNLKRAKPCVIWVPPVFVWICFGKKVTYQVRKDNTVPIKGNRYSVPIGTYKGPYTYVGVNKIGDKHLIIYDIETKRELAKHRLFRSMKKQIQTKNPYTLRPRGLIFLSSFSEI